MAPRANWKGYLKIAEVTCPVALYTAASTSDRVAFHILNRETGHRIQRKFLDSETEKPVEAENQVKGYEVAKDEYVLLEQDEIAAAIPASDKTLSVDAFIANADIDTLYFDKPYYLAPADKMAQEAFYLIREGMKNAEVAAIAHTVLFRRMRAVLIRPQGPGLVANTLNFDYEVRAAKDAFAEIPKTKIKGEMLDLARHIIDTKRGKFDPGKFDDRYEAALAELVKAKAEGKELPVRKERKSAKVIDLMEALRQSAGAKGKTTARKKATKTKAKTKAAAPRRKAG